MCGIFGYIGPRKVVETVLDGLKKLEYRGYDSAGIAGIKEGKILVCKEVGKIARLEQQVLETQLHLDIAVGQTRWATHGKPTRANAHPHFDLNQTLALVHNGIVENHESLRESLKSKGVHFVSETDTEVIAHLIASLYEGDLLQTLRKVMSQLEGSYAIALIHIDYPDTIFAFTHESPLAVGFGEKENFLSSDTTAFLGHAKEATFLADGEIAALTKNQAQFFDSKGKPLEKLHVTLSEDNVGISKGVFEHYTLKEIFDQPQAISDALYERLSDDYGTACFDEEGFNQINLLATERILILACGTSWHAGYIAAYMIEDKARIPVQLEISSEFRYKNAIVLPNTLIIAISQSGETADTLAAVRELQARGAKVLALCNQATSTLAREADVTLLMRAGPEIGVCSTKACTNQLVVLSLLMLIMGRIRHMTGAEGQSFIASVRKIPLQIQQILEQSPRIAEIAKKYAHYDNFFFLGRHYMYPTSLEGALKLKEISYINANGYPAGEMKHGPIALISESCPTVALCANGATFSKLMSNLMEVKARNGPILAIAMLDQDVSRVADDIIRIPNTSDALAPILTIVVTQLLAYYIAKERATDIDQPRNLAKSVTVE